MIELLCLAAGIAIGIAIQAYRSAKATSTTMREQIMRGGGPGTPVVPR